MLHTYILNVTSPKGLFSNNDYITLFTITTVNPLLSPPGSYLFQTNLNGGLIETGGLFERGGLFNLEKTMVSILHKKKLEYNVETLKYKRLEVMQPRIKNKSELLNHPGSVHTKFYSRD